MDTARPLVDPPSAKGSSYITARRVLVANRVLKNKPQDSILILSATVFLVIDSIRLINCTL